MIDAGLFRWRQPSLIFQLIMYKKKKEKIGKEKQRKERKE